MMKFNREEGLTLIELLITIAVLAIVAAIAIPVVTNVVNSTEDRAVAQTQSDVDDFVAKYNNVGAFSYTEATQTFEGYVDLNGDGSTTGEKIEELVIDLDTFELTTDADGVLSDITANYDAAGSTDFKVVEAN